MNRIYLDHAATSPLRPEARSAMEAWWADGPGGAVGNPSSLHAEGRRARMALDQARETFAETLGCLFGEVVFTSSGTEACNLAVLGSALATGSRGRILMSASEHHAVLHTRAVLERLGFEVTLVGVDREARLDLDALGAALDSDVRLVAVMHANNETGAVNPVAEAAALAHAVGALVFADAVQTFPFERGRRWRVDDLGADLVAASAHKFGGPPGVGALYVGGGTPFEPLLRGGGQEREVRAGTENVAGIIGAAAALRAAREDTRGEQARREARDAFLRVLAPDFVRTATGDLVLPGHAHVRLPGVPAETMLIRLDRMGVSASSGAACSSGSVEPSHVLLAAGRSPREANEGLRFTFGPTVTTAEAEEAARRVNEAADLVRAGGRGAY